MNTLAEGHYSYQLQGQRQPVHEPWRLLAGPDGGLSLLGRREVGKDALLEVEANYRRGGWLQARIHWRDARVRRTVDYRLGDGQLLWRLDQGEERALALPEDALLFPLLRAATGALLWALRDAPRALVLPCLRDPSDSARFLHPLLSHRRVRPLDGQRLLFCGGEYGDTGAEYRLNDLGLVEGYRWNSPQGLWDVRLEKLRTAGGFRGFTPAAGD